MGKYVSIGKAAEMLGVATSTLRRWDQDGKLVAERTARMYGARSHKNKKLIEGVEQAVSDAAGA